MATVVTNNNLPPILTREHTGGHDDEIATVHLARNPRVVRTIEALCGADDGMATRIAASANCIQCITMSLDGKVSRRYY